MMTGDKHMIDCRIIIQVGEFTGVPLLLLHQLVCMKVIEIGVYKHDCERIVYNRVP